MSITPSTTEQPIVPSYTVVGGIGSDRNSKPLWPLTVLVINRAGRFNRQRLIEQLERQGFAEILCVEQGAVSIDIEQQCRQYPTLRFLLLGAPCTVGVCLNLAIPEARSPYVLVMFSDLSLMPFVDHALEEILSRNFLCTVPLLRGAQGEVIPTLVMPARQRNKLKIVRTLPSSDYTSTLFPFDYLGIYHRERFIQSLGYDERIRNPFWQKVDFGFRAWLWGERIEASTTVRLQASLDIESEDNTPDVDYARFYLKNLLPRFTGDQAVLHPSQFFAFSRVSRQGFISGLTEFREIRDWIACNSYRFKHDAQYVTELWETGKEF